MPLTEMIKFQTVLEKGNRLQIPKLIQTQFKMDRMQVLKVTINTLSFGGEMQLFYAKMDKQGRLFVPRLQLARLTRNVSQQLANPVFSVTIEPV